MTPPATIKLFLPFGDPTRLRTAELSNWSGKAVAAPRSDLAELYDRPEVSQSGVYVLAGVHPKSGDAVAYVGEAEVLRDRLKQHASKDYWNRVVLFISKDENLTKAHVRYLEGAMIEEAIGSERARLMNAQSSGSRLPESDRADMDVYISKVRQLLPVLGFDLLTPIQNRASAPRTETFTCEIKGLVATGAPSSNGFVIFSGSQAVPGLRPSALNYIIAQRDRLLAEGLLTAEGDALVFRKDVEFSSPSMAASIVHGGSANGLIAWRDADGRTLKQIETASEPISLPVEE